MIVWLSLSFFVWYIIYWLTYVEPTLPFMNKANLTMLDDFPICAYI